MKQRRDTTMDVAKGFGMLAVILAHIITGDFKVFLYSFHLPLFFIISGYFFNCNDNFKTFFLKKCRSYLIPYFSCSLIVSLYAFLHTGFNLNVLREFIFKFLIQQRFQTLWFLAALFGAVMIFRGICTICKDNLKLIIPLSCCLSFIFLLYDYYVKQPLIWNLDTACISVFFLMVGYVFKKKNFISTLLSQTKKQKVWLLFLFIIIDIFCTSFNMNFGFASLEMFDSCYGFVPLTMLAAIFGTLAVIILASLMYDFKPLIWIGQNTMTFFAFHQYIALTMATQISAYIPLINGYSPLANFFNKFFLFVVTITICIIFHVVIINCHCGFILGKKAAPKPKHQKR